MPELIIEQNQTEEQDEIQDCVNEIRGTVEQAFAFLIERRDSAYADAIAPLNAEIESLTDEHRTIEGAARSLEELLPAKARMAQAEHDRRLIAGDRDGAAAKLAEQKQAENAPAAMRQRQQEILNRIESIEEQKRAAAIRIFNGFYPEAQTVVREAERGLFLKLLDGLRASFIEFENRTCPARSVQEVDPMVKGWHIENLTADGNSDVWVAGNRWYGGRGRR